METNPYAPPESDTAVPSDGPASLGELVRAWEKFRLYFNAILILPGVGILAIFVSRMQMPIMAAAVSAIFVAAAANVAFFLGPLGELYIRGLWLGGKPMGRGRFFIFAAGMTFSLCFFALIAVLGLL